MTTVEENKKRTLRSYVDQGTWFLKNRILPLFTTLLFFRTILREIRFSWVGFTWIMSAYKRWVTLAQRTKEIDEARSAASKQGLTFDHKIAERRDQRADRRFKASAIVAVFVALLFTIFYFVYRDNIATDLWGYQLTVFQAGLIAFVFGVFLLCDALGHTYVPPKTEEYTPRPVSPLEPGISTRKLQLDITEILRDECKPPINITFHGTTRLDHGMEFEVHLTDKLTDDHLKTLERHLQAGRNMVSIVHNRGNTAAPTLRVFWTDPLGGAVTPERRAPKSLSCKDPFYLTRDDTGNRPKFSVLGVHQFWAGRSGSGKSSGIWTLLDWLVDCRDADVYGIDLTNGPVFGAFKRVMKGVAYTDEEAIPILDAAIEECLRRNVMLEEGMDADEDGLIDENWVVTEKEGERAIFIVIDEYTSLAQKGAAMRTRVERIMEIGRKARVHIVISSPAADKKALGDSTTPVTQSMVKVIFGISAAMIVHLLGVGAAAEGWRPDRLEPATDEDPADSGKCYIHSPQFSRPQLQRFDRLKPEEIRERNRDRRAFLGSQIPEALSILRAAFTSAGKPDRLATAKILEHPSAVGWTATSLAAALKEASDEGRKFIAPAPKPMEIDGKTQRGYSWEGVDAAIKAVK